MENHIRHSSFVTRHSSLVTLQLSIFMSENEKPKGAAHEVSDVSTEAIVKFGLGLLTSTIVVFLFIWGLFHYFATREEGLELPRPPMAATDQLPPEPRLQGSRGHQLPPEREMKEMRAAQEAALHSYGWVDRNAGILRIPIEQAMQKLLEERLPARAAEPGQPAERKQWDSQHKAEGRRQQAEGRKQ
jgi:hypothetical protein